VHFVLPSFCIQFSMCRTSKHWDFSTGTVAVPQMVLNWYGVELNTGLGLNPGTGKNPCATTVVRGAFVCIKAQCPHQHHQGFQYNPANEFNVHGNSSAARLNGFDVVRTIHQVATSVATTSYNCF
jgi:hypothetical protein